MHEEVRDFIRRVKSALPRQFKGARVLEIGSYDINGSPREFFENCEYVGCDWRPGPGVDVVEFAHQLDYPDDSFDAVVSTECLEHDLHWRETLTAMRRMLAPGGLMIVTVAAFDRKPHEKECGVNNYYRNLQPEDLREFLDGAILYEENRLMKGIHFASLKPARKGWRRLISFTRGRA